MKIDKRHFIIGITGPSCSGKSSISEKLKEANDSQLIHLDDYWKDKTTFPRKYGFRNWELPQNLKFDLLYQNLQELKMGKKTKAPYCSEDGKFRGYKTLTPSEEVITEGFLLFYYEKIRDLFDLKLYVDISNDEVIRRRILRNRSNKNGKELYYREVVVKEYQKHGEPTKRYADLVVNGKEEINENIKKILEYIIK